MAEDWTRWRRGLYGALVGFTLTAGGLGGLGVARYAEQCNAARPPACTYGVHSHDHWHQPDYTNPTAANQQIVAASTTTLNPGFLGHQIVWG